MTTATALSTASAREALPGFPDFFLVGAPRCGTTSLSKHLAAHPQVCFSRPKEPHFFNRATPDEFADLRGCYLERCFPHYDAAVHRAVGEGSVSYLYDPDCIRRILSLSDEARFLVSVRNPVDMLPSYHFRMLYVLEEDETDFARAWELQEVRARGERIPARCLEPRLLQYAEVGRLGRRVEELIALAGRERVMVIVQDDLRSRPRELNRELCDFIGVDDDGRTEFPSRFKSKSYRHRWLHTMLFKPPAPVRRAMLRRERSGPRRNDGLHRLRKRLLYWNRLDRRPAALDPALRETLRATFSEDVQRLGDLIGRDLSSWTA